MATAPAETDAIAETVRLSRRDGTSPYVVVCDHASNFVPPAFASLGLTKTDLLRHIAWDPGALGVARALSDRLDAPLVESRVSRLVVDCNRALDAPDLVAATSEGTPVPGNSGLSAAARQERIDLAHAPFHRALDALIGERLAEGRQVLVVSVHSFTPVYGGVARPWHVGIVHDDEDRLSAPLLAALRDLPDLTVGDNQPYSPADRVYYTLERHARSRGLACVMIEIRNDEIADEAGQRVWGERLAGMLETIAEQAAGRAADDLPVEGVAHA
ncbi:MAG: N-formylglutamate amidohydrolase [Rhizobiaceae bacterium]|nr:N-formylglutamate amidohydrolase [Rhizobiaceae bacterium]MCV0406846.1 N-formylglutamate amidohydrolase [Rhizobiaceae bacterium]